MAHWDSGNVHITWCHCLIPNKHFTILGSLIHILYIVKLPWTICPHSLLFVKSVYSKWCPYRTSLYFVLTQFYESGKQFIKELFVKRDRCVEQSVGEGRGGMIWMNSIETYILSYVKQIASPGSVQETGCSGLVHWDDPAGRDGEGGGRGGSGWGTRAPMADSCQCMAKTTTIL